MLFILHPKSIRNSWLVRLIVLCTILVILGALSPSYARSNRRPRTWQNNTTTSTTKVSIQTTTSIISTTSLITTPITTVPISTTTAPQTTLSITSTTIPNNDVLLPFGQARNSNWNRIIFTDDFSGSLSKWQRNWRMGDDIRISPPANKTYEAACWDPKNTTTSNGMLVMKAEQRICTDAFGNTYNYATGGMSSGNFNFTYGYAEARIYLPPDSNNKIANFPAFWLNGTINDKGLWPAGGEIDIVEGLSDHLNNWHYHWGTSSAPQSSGGVPSSSLIPSLSNPSGWHTYGVDWSQGSIKFYYDGVLAATHTSGVVSTPMYIALDNAVPSRWAPTIPTNMLVDYVRVWQH